MTEETGLGKVARTGIGSVAMAQAMPLCPVERWVKNISMPFPFVCWGSRASVNTTPFPGTRELCLSQMVLLHRKLRNAGIEADLNVFEGMWHFFWENPDLSESREAMAALARFLNRHLE